MERSRKGPISAPRARKPRDVSVQGGSQSTNISVIRPSRITGPVALLIRLDDQGSKLLAKKVRPEQFRPLDEKSHINVQSK